MNSFLLKISSWLHLSKTKETIVQNLFWSVLGKIVALLSSLFVGIVVARHLGPEQYGLMDYVISYVFLFQTFAIFGLDSIEIREEARGLEPYQKIIGTAFTLKVFLGVICIAASVLTSWFMDADAYTTLLVAIYSLVIILNSFGVIRNYFTAIVQNEYVVKAEIARTLIGVGIKVLLLLLDASLTWFIVSYMFDFVLVSSGYYVAYHQKVGHLREWKFDYSYSKYLLRESFPLLLTSAY